MGSHNVNVIGVFGMEVGGKGCVATAGTLGVGEGTLRVGVSGAAVQAVRPPKMNRAQKMVRK